MIEPCFTIAEIEREWARRSIGTNQAWRIAIDGVCLFWDTALGIWQRNTDSEYRGLLAVYAMRAYGIEYRRANPNLGTPWRFWIPASIGQRRGQGSRDAAGPCELDADFDKADAVTMALMILVPDCPKGQGASRD